MRATPVELEGLSGGHGKGKSQRLESIVLFSKANNLYVHMHTCLYTFELQDMEECRMGCGEGFLRAQGVRALMQGKRVEGGKLKKKKLRMS